MKERKERRNKRKGEGRKGSPLKQLGVGWGERHVKSAWAALTKHHGLGDSQRTEIYFSQLWRLEVLDKGASTVGF